MAKTTRPPAMPDLQRALDRESYEWLAANLPDVLTALEAELARGAKPYDAKLMVLRDYGREELAKRIEQAARHIETERIR